MALDRPAPSDELDYQYDHCDHEDQVNQAATEVSQKAKQPQNKQYYYDCPKHQSLLLAIVQFLTPAGQKIRAPE